MMAVRKGAAAPIYCLHFMLVMLAFDGLLNMAILLFQYVDIINEKKK